MIYYFCHGSNAQTLRSLVNDWAPQLCRSIRIVPYTALASWSAALTEGTYIFTDIELLSETGLTVASQLADALKQAGRRVLNYPMNVLNRFALLKTLHAEGVNNFNVYQANEIPKRFPVFIRIANAHNGSLSDLLYTQEAVNERLSYLTSRGLDTKDLILTEFSDTSDTTGMFRKYSCFMIGGSFVARHIFFSRNWVTKLDSNEVDATLVKEEFNFVNETPHPHEEFVRRMFSIANLEYGRIDYSVVDGKCYVWEINTNPIVMSDPNDVAPVRFELQKQVARKIADAFTALASENGQTNTERINELLLQGSVVSGQSTAGPSWRFGN